MTKKRAVLIGVFLLTALVLGRFIAQNVLRSRAGAPQVSITVTPKDVSIAGTQTVDLLIKTSEVSQKISGFDLRFTVSGPVKVTDSGLPADLTTGNKDLFTQLIKKSDRVSFVAIKGTGELPSVITLPITIGCDSTGAGTFSIDTAQSQVVGGTDAAGYTFGEVDTASVTCTSASAVAQVKAGFSPSSASEKKDALFSTRFVLEASSGHRISGWDIELEVGKEVTVESIEEPEFGQLQTLSALSPTPPSSAAPDASSNAGSRVSPTGSAASPGSSADLSCTTDADCPAKIKAYCQTAGKICPLNPIIKCAAGSCVVGEADQPPSDPPKEAGKCTKLFKEFDKEKRTIRLAYVCVQSDTDLPAYISTGLNLKGVEEGSGSITVSKAQVVGAAAAVVPPALDGGAGQTGELQVEKGSFSYVIGEGAGGGGAEGAVRLNLAFKAQGIVAKPAKPRSLQMRIGLVRPAMKEPVYKTGDFTVDESGIWKGAVGFDLPEASDYTLYAKGDMHIQKKICNESPTETFPGTYNCSSGKITIKNGDQSFDMSKIYVLVGDLPSQDGVVNAYDIALARNSIGKTDESSLKSADLNMDGAVNAQDYALVIAALSVRQDEQ